MVSGCPIPSCRPIASCRPSCCLPSTIVPRTGEARSQAVIEAKSWAARFSCVLRKPAVPHPIHYRRVPPGRGEILCISLWTDRASVRLPPRCNVLLKVRAAEDSLFASRNVCGIATRLNGGGGGNDYAKCCLGAKSQPRPIGGIDLDQCWAFPCSLGCRGLVGVTHARIIVNRLDRSIARCHTREEAP
jgi:hypothetical protein